MEKIIINKDRQMKEITGKEWAKKYKPKKMWCWDNDENNRVQMKVIYVSEKDLAYPVVAISDTDRSIERYKHCAECKEK